MLHMRTAKLSYTQQQQQQYTQQKMPTMDEYVNHTSTAPTSSLALSAIAFQSYYLIEVKSLISCVVEQALRIASARFAWEKSLLSFLRQVIQPRQRALAVARRRSIILVSACT